MPHLNKLTFLLFIIFCFCSKLLVSTAIAQEKINNEFRLTLVPTFPINKKVFVTTYIGYVNNTGTNTSSFYVGAPGIITYKVNKVVEVMTGAFLIVANAKEGNDSKEFRPFAGLKLKAPNTGNLHIFNWTRYEFRSFTYPDDKSLNNTKNRIRNRMAIEFPLSKNAWEPKSWYGFSDFEFFYTFEKGYFDRFRQRFGGGYIIDKQWRAEFIYHIQLVKSSKDLNPVWNDNIFRLNIKWAIPNKKLIPHHFDQLDLDE
jgi:hypothetical protein